MQKHFASFCANLLIVAFFLTTPNAVASDAVFTGKLVRKYYGHLIPQAVELEVFGWFLELDSFSKAVLQNKIGELSVEDRQCCTKFAFDSSIVQLCLSGVDERQQCREVEGKQVEVKGEWPKSPHMFRPIPSYQVHLTDMKQTSEDIQELRGVLIRKVFPGPPNYDSVEDGDYPEVGWILKLDDGEIEIEAEKPFEDDLPLLIDRKVICRGVFRDAENAHHHTPILLVACMVIAETN